MFFSLSPLKSAEVFKMSPIDLLDYASTELSRFYTSKLPWVDQWEWWNSNFVDFTFSRTEGSFLNQFLNVWDINTSKEYHPHRTQGFPRQYLDELLIFRKEIRFYRNNKDRHFAYSYPPKPCIVIDCLALDLDPKVLSTFRDNEFGAKFEQY